MARLGAVPVPAQSFWQLDQSLPTGTLLPVDAGRDLRSPRLFGDLQLDDVLTDLDPARPEGDGLRLLGRVQSLTVWACRTFRRWWRSRRRIGTRSAWSRTPAPPTRSTCNSAALRPVGGRWSQGAMWTGVVELALGSGS